MRLVQRLARVTAVAALILVASDWPAGAAASNAHHYRRHASHHATSGIPQHNGGDRDSDNNGGPSDGDRNV
jgi:hypothetical protein